MNQTTPSILPTWTTRQIISATLVVFFIGLGFWLLYQFRLVIFILFVAIVLGTALSPVVSWLARRGLPPVLGITAIYLLLLAALVSTVIFLVPTLVDQAAMIAATVPDYYRSFRSALLNYPNLMLQQFAWQLPPELSATSLMSQTEQETAANLADGVNSVSLAFRSIFTTIAALSLSFYWTFDRQRTLRTLLLLVPVHRRESIRELIEAMEAKVGAYIRGQAILCGAIGLLSLIAYVIIGVPYALTLALVAGVLEAVPWIGPVLGAIPAMLVVVSLEPSKVIWVIAATMIIQLIENLFLVPRVMDRAVGVHPIVTLLAFFTFGSLWGVTGALLAIPIAAVLQLLLIDRFLLSREAIEQQLTGRDHLSVLRYEVQQLLQDVRRQSRNKVVSSGPDEQEDQIEDQIEVIVADLDSLLAQAESAKTKGVS